ncbi:MAG TPA: hypothetical protein VMM83_06955 [Longimicrobiales bacterium]|nr:hypothetical protein [Longimicrobiales bacterium]
MKPKHFHAALAAALVAVVVAACGSSDPTAPAIDTPERLDVALDQRAVVDPVDPFDVDENDNGIVCVKTVPASENASARAGARIIVKDDRDGECPGGFEPEFLPG